MSEELFQRGLIENPEKIGKWDFYNIGSTSLKSLKEHSIIPNRDYKEYEKRKPDGIIVHKKNVIAAIENKKPSEFNSNNKKLKAIKQGLDVSQVLRAKLLIVTDSKETLWVNALNGEIIIDEIGNKLVINFNANNMEAIKLIEKILESVDEHNSQLIPLKVKDPSPLAKQIWQDIWSVSGATPENCLYTFVELFIFKYLSDLHVLTGIYSFNNLLQQYRTNSEEEVLEFYANTIRKKIKELFPMNPKDKTTIINGSIFVSKDEKAVKGYSVVFKKILDKFENEGKLQNIHYDFKSKIFESFLKESISKKNWGQFFTPLKVVSAIVKMVEIKEGMVICDPACGVGKFLLEPILQDIKRFYKVEENKIKSKIKLIGFDKGFDKDEQKTIILAKANMLIYFSDLIKEYPLITEQFSKLFNDTFLLKTNSILGTLSEVINDEYDLILTNPPYVTSGSSNLKDEIIKSGLTGHYKINALGVEGLFMEWIVRALKPGGTAVVVVPDGIMNRQNDERLRKFILDECFVNAVISLPVNIFFTTPKKTYILSITKKRNKEEQQQDPVFTYIVNSIGETLDVYRFDTLENDLDEAVLLYKQFLAVKKHFKTVEKKCKIQDIEKFTPENHWSVDRWWTQLEKIELGIMEEKNSYSMHEFGSYLGDFASSVAEYQALLNQVNSESLSKLNFVEISLADVEYFDLFIGKRILKKDLIKITNGKIPAYSANVFIPVGFLRDSNISSFDLNNIIWGIDGNFEFNVIEENKKFATTDHCGTIRIKSDAILPYYLVSELIRISHEYGFDRGLRASLKNMKRVMVKIPVTVKGGFDIEAQREISKKFQTITEIKSTLKDKLDSIVASRIDILK